MSLSSREGWTPAPEPAVVAAHPVQAGAEMASGWQQLLCGLLHLVLGSPGSAESLSGCIGPLLWAPAFPSLPRDCGACRSVILAFLDLLPLAPHSLRTWQMVFRENC